jgi:hypothetical protein
MPASPVVARQNDQNVWTVAGKPVLDVPCSQEKLKASSDSIGTPFALPLLEHVLSVSRATFYGFYGRHGAVPMENRNRPCMTMDPNPFFEKPILNSP